MDCAREEYYDAIVDRCFPCKDICHPRYDTLTECFTKCRDVVEQIMLGYYGVQKAGEGTSPEPVPTTTCLEVHPEMVWTPLLLGLGLAALLMLLLLALGCYKLGGYMRARRSPFGKKTAVQAMDAGNSCTQLLPNGSTRSPETSQSASPDLSLREDPTSHGGFLV